MCMMSSIITSAGYIVCVRYQCSVSIGWLYYRRSWTLETKLPVQIVSLSGYTQTIQEQTTSCSIADL